MAGLEFIQPNGERGFVELHCPRFIVGRASDCDLTVDDAWASRQHVAIVLRDDGQHEMQDLGSGNGTKWNDAVHGVHLMSAGDVLRIGRTSLTYRASDQASTGNESSSPRLSVARTEVKRLQVECELLRSLVGTESTEGATLLQSEPTRVSPQMDLTFPTVDGGAGPQLYEPAAWAFVGVGAESLAFIESLVDLGHRRVVALVDEMLPAARVSLPGRWVCRLHGDDGVLQGLQPTLEEARDSILQLVMGDGGPAAELFIVMDDGAVSEGSALVAALSDLSSELRGQEETAAVRLHGIITMDSAVTPDVRETLAAIMSAGWLCTVLLIPSERYASPQPSGSPLPAASIVDLLSWLPRMAAADGGFSEPALRSHLKTSGLSTVALLGSSDTSEGACRQIASTILGSGSICDGLAPATARSAVVVGFVGQQDLNTDPELMDRARAALAAIGQQVPQARVNQGLYVVETPGVRVLVALFGLA